MLLRKLFALFAISLFAGTASAQELGPATGTKIPHDLSLMTTAGKIENFDDLKGGKWPRAFFRTFL